MSGIIAQPGSIKKAAVAAFFKLRNTGFDKEECKDCLKSISDDLNEYVQWLKDTMEQKLKEIELYIMTGKKQKALDNVNFRMRGDNTLKMVEILSPFVAKVKKAYKIILKEDKVPDDVKMELTTVMYLVDKMNIMNWTKLKKQLLIKYGNDWMEKVELKKKNVNEEILTFLDYKPKEKDVRDVYKDYEDAWKLKLKKEDEELDIEELSDDVETESDTQVRDVHNLDDIDSDDLGTINKPKKHVKKSLKKDSDSDSSSEEEKKSSKKPSKKDSDSSSEEEKKPVKKSLKKDSDSDSDSSSEEEKKPKKSVKKDSDSDSDSSSEEEKKSIKKSVKKDSDSDSSSD